MTALPRPSMKQQLEARTAVLTQILARANAYLADLAADIDAISPETERHRMPYQTTDAAGVLLCRTYDMQNALEDVLQRAQVAAMQITAETDVREKTFRLAARLAAGEPEQFSITVTVSPPEEGAP